MAWLERGAWILCVVANFHIGWKEGYLQGFKRCSDLTLQELEKAFPWVKSHPVKDEVK